MVVPEERLSADGRVPRKVQSARREAADTAYRSAKQEGRLSLASELFEGVPPTLVKLRLSRGYSQQQLAGAIGTSQSHIAKIEAGSLNLMWDTAVRLADALGVRLDELRPLIKSAPRAAKDHG